jgi:signal transduction histidine kinase
MVGSFYVLFRNFMYTNITHFEKYELNKEVSFAQKNIQREAYHLDEKVGEWGNWDDTYRFVQDRNKNYIENNLSTLGTIFKQGNHVILFVNSSNQLVYGVKFDMRNSKLSPVPNDLAALVATKKLTQERRGILIIEDKIYVVATRPIKTSKGAGQSRGFVLLAREMDPFLLDSQHAEKLSFKFEILKNTKVIPTGEKDRTIKEVSNDKISETALIADVLGRPALKLEVTLDRYMLAYAKNTLSFLVISLLMVSLLFAAAILYMVRKITQLEQQVAEAGKLGALGALSANIAHELNNPLTIVHGYAQNMSEIISDEKVSTQKLNSCINKITSQTERMMTIIKYIKDFTRYAEGDTLNPEDLNGLISKVVHELEPQLEAHKIIMDLRLNGAVPPVFVNPTKMYSVIQNILSNARDAVDERGNGKDKKIKVTTAVEKTELDSFIVVKVTDNGIGISKQNLNKVFEPYYTTKDIGKGVGLGLSLVQGVVKEYNGTISAESSKGETTFTLKLPINPLLEKQRNLKERA